MGDSSLIVHLDGKTVKELREEAKDMKIRRYTCMRKHELIDAIINSSKDSFEIRVEKEEPVKQKGKKVENEWPIGSNPKTIKKLTKLMPMKN